MKYMAFYIADFLYPDERIGDLCFFYNKDTNMFEMACDLETAYDPAVVCEMPEFLLFKVQGTEEDGTIEPVDKTKFLEEIK